MVDHTSRGTLQTVAGCELCADCAEVMRLARLGRWASVLWCPMHWSRLVAHAALSDEHLADVVGLVADRKRAMTLLPPLAFDVEDEPEAVSIR